MYQAKVSVEPGPWPRLQVEAVTTCVDYADFLAWTLPQNRHQFDGYVVVTAPHDKETIDLCSHYHVRCVQTDVFYHQGKAFNKAAGINVGISQLSRSDWLVHIDADILLPPRAKEMIERAQPREDSIYGIDRMDCSSFADLVKFQCKPELQYVAQTFMVANRFPRGARLVREQGYVPIGFFQLWHPSTSGIDAYSEVHDDFNNHSDVSHAEQWPRSRRGFIPEIVALHLMSESPQGGGMGNWRGRRTKRFGAE